MPNRKLTSLVYPGLAASGDATRINPMVSDTDCRTIVGVSGSPQILSHICQLAIKTTANYVRHNKLDFTTRDKLAEFLGKRPFTAVNAPEAVERDESRRDSVGGESVAATASGQQSLVGKGVKGKRSGEEGKVGKAVGKGTKSR